MTLRAERGIVVDLFAGGGGASVGVEAALGRSVDIAINHDPVAIAVHRANHPHTLHLEADVWEVKPLEATGGRPVDLLWASPDCTHFSRAKGGKPRDHKNRSLAWVVVNWARDVRPRVICLENVREFATWGPLDPDGRTIREESGRHYDEWTEALRRLGYQVESRVLDASLYGAPTRRLRLFVVARCDGEPIRWPEPTHGPGRLPLRSAAECIDWSLPCPSIFDRKRPLAPATLRRVAAGVRRFVLESAAPFVINMAYGGTTGRGRYVYSADDPLRTITTNNGHGVVVPMVLPNNTNNVPKPGSEPVPTVTTGDRNYLLAPSLVHTGNGERDGQRPRVKDIEDPFGTVTATGSQGALVSSFLARYHGERRQGERARVEEVGDPLPVQTTEPRFGLVSAFLARHFGGMSGRDLQLPLPTITAVDHHGPVVAHISKFYGTSTGSGAGEPAPTVTAGAGGGHQGLVAASISKYYGGSIGSALDEPHHTITAKARFALVAAFLQAHGLDVPPEAVVVPIEGALYAIADIGLRMLRPHELLRAQFGDYADRYDLSAAKTQAAKIRLIGNSVCPDVARALVEANCRAEKVQPKVVANSCIGPERALSKNRS